MKTLVRYKPRWRNVVKAARYSLDDKLGGGNIIAWGIGGVGRADRSLSNPFLWHNAALATLADDYIPTAPLGMESPVITSGTGGVTETPIVVSPIAEVVNAIVEIFTSPAGVLVDPVIDTNKGMPADVDYLNRYPDVAAAVSAGDFTSGYQHYDLWGRDGGRYYNLWLNNPTAAVATDAPIVVTAETPVITSEMAALAADDIITITPKQVNVIMAEVIQNVDPTDIATIDATIAIAQEVIPELTNMQYMTATQVETILDVAKTEAIAAIVEVQPTANVSQLQNISSAVEVVQMAEIIQAQPGMSFTQAQQTVQAQTAQTIQEVVSTTPIIPVVTIPPSLQPPVLPSDEQLNKPVVPPILKPIIPSVLVKLGVAPSAKQDTTKEMNGIYIAGAVAVLGILVLMIKK
jgi:hypothetical protein